jgi:exodeoxyribonuclease VII large subunit
VGTRLVVHEGRLAAAVAKRVHTSDARFKALAARLDGLSPLAVLARGYAVVWDRTRTRVLRDANAVALGDEIITRLEHGEIKSTVTERKES